MLPDSLNLLALSNKEYKSIISVLNYNIKYMLRSRKLLSFF